MDGFQTFLASHGRASLIPYVVERDANGERSYDLFSRMLRERIMMITGGIETNMAQVTALSLLYLESLDATAPIDVFINSPGGVINAGYSIFDTMQFISCPVHTTVMGMAASMGSFLAMAGEPGHRCSLPNAEIMIHQPSGGAQGQASDIVIQAAHIDRLKVKLTREYVSRCNGKKTFEEFRAAMDRDYYMDPEEALEWGLIDRIITKRSDVLK